VFNLVEWLVINFIFINGRFLSDLLSFQILAIVTLSKLLLELVFFFFFFSYSALFFPLRWVELNPGAFAGASLDTDRSLLLAVVSGLGLGPDRVHGVFGEIRIRSGV
jgi:hypothetical protein